MVFSDHTFARSFAAARLKSEIMPLLSITIIVLGSPSANETAENLIPFGLELFGGFHGEALIERDQVRLSLNTPAADSRSPNPSTRYMVL